MRIWEVLLLILILWSIIAFYVSYTIVALYKNKIGVSEDILKIAIFILLPLFVVALIYGKLVYVFRNVVINKRFWCIYIVYIIIFVFILFLLLTS